MIKPEVQGDVMLRPSSLPSGAKKVKTRPIALGEVSGHAHVIAGEKQAQSGDVEPFQLFEHGGKTFVTIGGDGVQLQHISLHTGKQADHFPIALEKGMTYEIILQNEFNPESEAMQRVLD